MYMYMYLYIPVNDVFPDIYSLDDWVSDTGCYNILSYYPEISYQVCGCGQWGVV